MGGGRDQDGVQDGRSSATAVLTERKGVSVCGGARTTSSYGEAGGGRRATSSYGEAAFRSVVVRNRHSMMSRTRCFGGRGSAPLKQEAEAHAVYLSLGGTCVKHEGRIVPCRVMPYHGLSYHAMSHGAVSCRVVCRVVSCRVASRRVSCRVMSHHAVPCRITACHVVSCRIVSYRIVPCRVVSCHVVSCRIMPCRVGSSCFLQ